MDKILSIIVPTYNMEKYLHKCLDSLIVSDENMKLLEVLVINDGSKDSSSQIAHEYETKYPQTFKVIDKENGNYGSCINRGLKEIRGKYVKILDADDYFDTRLFDLFIIKLLSTHTDLVLTDFDKVDEHDTKTRHHLFTYTKNKVLSGTEIWTNKSLQNVHMHSITYKSEIFTKITYQQSEGISYTDQEWIFTPMSVVENCIYYPISVYQYLIGRPEQSMNPKTMKKNISHTMQGVYKMCDDIAAIGKNKSEVLTYFNYKLSQRCKYVYKFHLIYYPNLEQTELIKLDQYIKKHVTDVYEQTNQIKLNKYIPFYYIKKWRSEQYNSNGIYWKFIKLLYTIHLL